jgi:DNA-binding NtrC family response regulator
MVADTLALAKKGLPRSHRPLRIVSVDDEDWRLEIVEIVVSAYFKGVTVQSFRDAEEAWQELLRTAPDLLIADDIMGNLNGRDIVRRLADRKAAYPIIVIQGWPEGDQWVLDCVKRGEDVTLLRAPYDAESLLRAVESGLKISRDTTGPVGVVPHPRRTRPLRIVILDDEPFACDALRMVLQFDLPNAEILTFTNVAAALEELEREDPDLFTTDFEHPGTKGDELLQILAERKAKYPVFVISSYGESLASNDFLKRFLDQGLNVSLVSKPFSVEELRSLLLKHIRPSDNPERQIWKGAP